MAAANARKHVRYEAVVPESGKIHFDQGYARREIGSRKTLVAQNTVPKRQEPDAEDEESDAPPESSGAEETWGLPESSGAEETWGLPESSGAPLESSDPPPASSSEENSKPDAEEPTSEDTGTEEEETAEKKPTSEETGTEGEEAAEKEPTPEETGAEDNDDYEEEKTESVDEAGKTEQSTGATTPKWDWRAEAMTKQKQHPQIFWTIAPFLCGFLVLLFWICQGRERPREERDKAMASLRVEGTFADGRHRIVESRATQDVLHTIEGVTPLGAVTDKDLAIFAKNSGKSVGALVAEHGEYTPEAAAELIQKAAHCYKLKLSKKAVIEAAGGLLTLSNAIQALKAKKDEQDKIIREVHQHEPEHAAETDLFANVHFEDEEKDKYDEREHGKPVLFQKSHLEELERSELWSNGLAFMSVYLPLRIIALLYVWYIWVARNDVVMFAGYWFLISRMEGLLLALLTMCVIFLMTRGLLKNVRNCFSEPNCITAILDKHVLIHRLLAGPSMVFSAFWHTLAHNLALVRALHTNPEAAQTLKGELSSNPSEYLESGAYGSWPNVTGYILLAILLGFCSLSNKRARKWSFEVFHYPHLIFTWLWVTFLISHGAMGWTGLGVPVCLILVFPIAMWYGIERGFHIRSSTEPAIFIESALVYGKSMVLQINLRGSDYSYTTGEYSMIRAPEFSMFQWHPFTIASSSEHQLRLIIGIQKEGSFTRELANRIQAAQKKAGEHGTPIYPQINVRGGFGAPASGMHFAKHFVMVGGGVGATPFLSFLSSICNEWVMNKKLAASRIDFSHVRKARFYWVSRDVQDFTWVNHYSEVIRTHPDLAERISVHLILSQALEKTVEEGISAQELALFWHSLRVAMASGAKEINTCVGVPTQFGRPNWEKEFVDMASQIEADDKTSSKTYLAQQHTVGVYICGNPMIAVACEHAAVKVSNKDIEFKLFVEEF
jgi:predicted ferric reductase